jgi:hypothetical protein
MRWTEKITKIWSVHKMALFWEIVLEYVQVHRWEFFLTWPKFQKLFKKFSYFSGFSLGFFSRVVEVEPPPSSP